MWRTREERVVYRDGVEGVQTKDIAQGEGPKGRLTMVAFMPGIRGLVTVFDTEEQLVMYADRETAGTFWAPVIPATGDSASFVASGSPSSASSPPHLDTDPPLHPTGVVAATTSPTPPPFAAFFSLGTNASILISGPYLVRNASLTDDGVLHLMGDLKESVILGVVGPRGVREASLVRWNGGVVESLRGAGAGVEGEDWMDGVGEEWMRDGRRMEVTSEERGGFVGLLRMPDPGSSDAASRVLGGIEPPVLDNWMYMDSLPEVMLGEKYDDGWWVEANKTGTNIPWEVYYRDGEWDGRVFHGCDYGL